MATITKEHKADGVRYRVEVRITGPDGQRVRKTRRCRTKREAERWASRVEVEIRDGRVTQQSAIRWRDLIEGYLAHPEGAKRLRGEAARSGQERMLRWWISRVGSLKVAATVPPTIDRHLSDLRKCGPSGGPVSGATSNRYLSALSAVYRWAERRYGLRRRDNPTAGLRAKEPPGDCRWLSDEEREMLLEEVRQSGHKKLELLIHLGLTTGHRQGPLVKLRWSQIDRAAREIRLGKKTTKNGLPLVLPLAPSVEALLDQQIRRVDTDYVFPPGPKGVPTFPRKSWDTVREKLYDKGVEPFVFHTLRHSAASYLAQSGWSLVKIASFLGHRSTASTQRYAHLVQAETAHDGLAVLAARGIS